MGGPERAAVTFTLIAAIAATVTDAATGIVGIWHKLDPIYRVILVVAEATYPLVVSFRELVPFWRKHVANRKVAASFTGPGAPELRPGHPAWVFHIQAPGKIGTWLEGLEDLWSARHMATGRVVVPTYLRTADDVDAWVQMARVRAAETRGLRFLSSIMQQAILWHIVLNRLEASGAPQDALLAARAKLDSLQTGPLYDALFSKAKMTRVELLPSPAGETYFTRYFQPLMVAFDEQRFADSGGIGSEDERHALMNHLNHLAGNRVMACRFDGIGDPLQGDAVRPRLPREIRNGPQHRVANGQAKVFNKKEAALAILVVCNAAALNTALAFEQGFRPTDRYAAAAMACDYWTPFLDGHAAPHCFLWQARRE